MSILKNILLKLGTSLLPLFLKQLFATLRLEVSGPADGLPGTGRGIVFAFWHGDMVTGWLLARKLFPERRPSAVVSLSPDGQILSDTLERLGFRLIRGSSSRGRDDVRAGIAGALREGGLVAVTPDGPRGPAHQFKFGTVRLASEHGVPILFADIRHSKAKRLRSWDRFEIPAPFSRVDVTLHRVDVPAFPSEEELREFTNRLSERFAHA